MDAKVREQAMEYAGDEAIGAVYRVSGASGVEEYLASFPGTIGFTLYQVGSEIADAKKKLTEALMPRPTKTQEEGQ